MKDKLNRLAKGITDEDEPVVKISPDAFSGTVFAGRKTDFTIEAEAVTGKGIRGAAGSDDYRVEVLSETFAGRAVNVAFSVNTEGLLPGDRLTASVDLVTNGGEFCIPLDLEVTRAPLYGEEYAEPAGHAPAPVPEKPAAPSTFDPDIRTAAEKILLMRYMPEDEELFADAVALLIKEDAAGQFAREFYREAIRRDVRLTYLFESYMNACTDEMNEPMPQEVLIYYSYEKQPDTLTADRLYANVIRFTAPDSEIYRTYEPAMRDHAAASVLSRRVNADLAVIYDRMLYPDMIDLKSAAILPDIVKSVKITVSDPAVKNVHVKYDGLKTVAAAQVKNGKAYIPVYFNDAVIELADDRGNVLRSGSLGDFDAVKLLNRPDLLRRCFELAGDHRMLLFSALREILSRGVRTPEERQILASALEKPDLTMSMRGMVIRALLKTGGDPSWLDNVSVSEIDAETGMMAFRGFLKAGRFEDAYIYLRQAGYEKADPKDLYTLVSALLTQNRMPVTETGEPDRFLCCLAVRLFEAHQVSPVILDFLADKYSGPGRKMYEILKVITGNSLPAHDLPERTVITMIFSGTRESIDDAFSIYAAGGVYKEIVLKAYFSLRMSDYFEKQSTEVSKSAFEALSSYLAGLKNYGLQPDIYALGLTKYWSENAFASEKEQELCQKLTDMLISRELVFPYTKVLRKKIDIPASICEKFYVEYRGEPSKMTVRILPDEKDFRNAGLRKVWKNIHVAGEVLFCGDRMEYRIYEDDPEKPAVTGSISVKKAHGKDDDSYARLNQMLKALADGETVSLADSMIKYGVETEVNRKLFGLEQ